MIFEVQGRSWGVLMCVGAVLECLGVILGRLEGFFGQSWGCFMASWAAIAASWASLGRSWGGLGAALGRARVLLACISWFFEVIGRPSKSLKKPLVFIVFLHLGSLLGTF